MEEVPSQLMHLEENMYTDGPTLNQYIEHTQFDSIVCFTVSNLPPASHKKFTNLIGCKWRELRAKKYKLPQEEAATHE